jgi:hypothetical protein
MGGFFSNPLDNVGDAVSNVADQAGQGIKKGFNNLTKLAGQGVGNIVGGVLETSGVQKSLGKIFPDVSNTREPGGTGTDSGSDLPLGLIIGGIVGLLAFLFGIYKYFK